MSEQKVDLEEEGNQIINEYRGLIRLVRNRTSSSERKEIRRGFEFALHAHDGIRRKSGEAYIFHPLAVAKIVAKEIKMDATSITCALLHDVVEDTEYDLDDIEREFGSEVRKIIDGLTKISTIIDHTDSGQAENYRKMLLTLSDDIRVTIIKLADRLHNMRTLGSMKESKKLKIGSETLYLYAPLANRLGLNNIKTELEDLSLKNTSPTEYNNIHSKLLLTQRKNKYFIQSFIRSIRERLNSKGLKFKIKSRYKSVFSIFSKMKRQGINFDEVFDLFAIRIILDSTDEEETTDCWKVYSSVTELYKPNPERIRDWISHPKSNGYESLHVTVMGPTGKWVEVQIRSERMDQIAEYGFAAHHDYKGAGLETDQGFDNWLNNVRELLENRDLNAVEAVRQFKSDLVTDEVFVFTPKGDLRRMPKGASAIDFAFEIHTRIGESCIGAKVHNKVVPLSYKLNNGDQVEIITSKKQRPNQEWLKYAKTSKATNRIKENLKKQRKEIIEKGRGIFEFRKKKHGFTDASNLIKEITSYFELDDTNEFLYRLGAHSIDTKKLIGFIDQKLQGKDFKRALASRNKKRIKDRSEFEQLLEKKWGIDTDMLIIGRDMNVSDYKFAPCCEPLPGDDILGFFDGSVGLAIHRTSCKVAISLMSNYGGNIIKTRWTDLSGVSFLAGVKISGEDRYGMMNDLIREISQKMKLNIRSITIDSLDGMFEGFFKIFVHSSEEIEALSKKLKKVSGVLTVSRVQNI